MARDVPLITYYDAIARLITTSGGAARGRDIALAKRAILDALDILTSTAEWRYYWGRRRITTEANYDTGTITYDHTGGASERLLTLASGTWPTNADKGLVRIDNVEYEVETRLGDTTVTLTEASNPGEDVDAGTSYEWVRDAYQLPSDFASAGPLRDHASQLDLTYVPPAEWIDRHRTLEASNNPRIYTTMKSRDDTGALALFLYPPPSSAYALEFVYKRRPYMMRTPEYTTGTISTTADSATVTGSSTAFTSKMEGAVIRVGDSTNVPDGLDGENPFSEERVILSVASGTSLTVTSAFDSSASTVKYRISDALDIEKGAMFTALMACAQWQYALQAQKGSKVIGEFARNWYSMAKLAMAADRRHSDERATGPKVSRRLAEIGTASFD